ncbi:efflux RND transporter permease subunit [Brevibacillus sedimenti]|uniref:efflux RND transporter permease subunit n=1 Tax=Brevibacillus sedimenti TaxID=2613334 RepID=UPI001E6065ED|nr:efflux RND transporter permease subunit [Anoxybacillus sediminis]UFJ61787.1 efflux RND transporter permease subunit [Anoxybacillus sediminis]
MSKRTYTSTLPTLAGLLALVCCLLTVGALSRMDVALFPDRPLPEYVIALEAPGMSAEAVDESVTRPVENAVRELDAGVHISAESRSGGATLTVKTAGRPASSYKGRLEQKLQETTARLPISGWRLSQANLADNQIGRYLLHGADVQALADAARYAVHDKLASIPGVARVEVEDHSVREEVELVFRPSMLLTYGLTPGDVLGQLRGVGADEQVGAVGTGGERTAFQWKGQLSGPQELAQKLIATEKGYVPLKELAEVRDLRGSRGEEVTLYHGEPAVGISVFATEAAQVPAIRAKVAQAVAEWNEQAAGRYTLDLVEDRSQALTAALRDIGWLVAVAGLGAAVMLGVWLRSAMAALLMLYAACLSLGALLGGMWLIGVPLTLTSLGPTAVFALLYVGAAAALIHRLAGAGQLSPVLGLREAWSLLKPLLLAVVVCAAGWCVLMVTDFVKAADLPLLYDALPVLTLGTLTMLLVYGFIVPVQAAQWLTGGAAAGPAAERKHLAGSLLGGRVGRFLKNRWERSVNQGFLPYGITVALSLLAVVLLDAFVLTEPYGDIDGQEKTLSLEMVKGSTLDEAIQAARVAEERLSGLEEVRDLYTTASRERLTFHLKLIDKSRWTRTPTELEKELDKRLREIPGTDPFAVVLSEDQKTRLEFYVKGPSLHTVREIASQTVAYLQELRWTDKDGREIITDERIGEGDMGTYIAIRPRPEMLVRYRVTEEEIKRQLATYLGKQQAGTLYGDNGAVPVTARFPDKWMEHPDQVKQILIRTPQGAVRLGDLTEWTIVDEPPVYRRVDGMYVIKLSSAVSMQDRIRSLSYVIPDNMKEIFTIPEGYEILNASEWDKLEEAEANKKDTAGRLLAVAVAAAAVLLCSLLLYRRMRHGMVALALLPVLAGGVTVGLLWLDRPLNLMGVYGIAAVCAVMTQQALIHLDELFRADAAPSVLKGIRVGTVRAIRPLVCVLAATAAACLPLAAGWMEGAALHASFAVALMTGLLLAAYAVLVLVPAMQHATEQRLANRAGLSLAELRSRLHAWWENEQVRRRDARMRQRQEKEQVAKGEEAVPVRDRHELTEEDFQPLPVTARDAHS